MSKKVRNDIERYLTKSHDSVFDLVGIAQAQQDGRPLAFGIKGKYKELTGKTQKDCVLVYLLGNCPCCVHGLTLYAQIFDRKGRVVEQIRRPIDPDVLDELGDELGYCPSCVFTLHENAA